MMTEMVIDLPESVIRTVVEVAAIFKEIERIEVFGSRVLGNAKKGSDIDLAVFGVTLTPQILNTFQRYLEEETNIPYLFDIIHFESTMNKSLCEHILEHGRLLYAK